MEGPYGYDAQPSATEQRAGRNTMLWGIAIAVIAGGISLGTYFTATGGGTYLVLWGGVIVGAIQFLRGWIKASAKWRLIGTIAGIAIVIGGMMAFRAAPDIYNSAQVGDCVDSDGLLTDCSETDAVEIVFVKRYPDEMAFPGEKTFDTDSELCPSAATSFVSPSMETWEDGDRLLACLR